MKKLLAIIALCLIFTGLIFPVAALAEPAQQLLYDEADVLSDDEEARLSQMLSEATAKYHTDIAAATLNGTDGQDITTFSDYFILNNNLGQNDGQDAILFLIDVEGREWHFSTHGETIYAFTDGGIEELGNQVLPYLRESNWAGAIEEYCQDAGGYIDYKQQNGVAVGQDTSEKSPVIPGVIGVVAGILGSLGITKGMKAQLETVRSKPSASDYFDPRNLNLRRHSDTFLYMNVSRVPINTDKNSGGGGFTTHSTGGSSFGGGGGKF